MKYTFAIVLIALFAVISISQAMPQPEDAAAASNEGASADIKFEVELSPEELAALESLGGRAFDWKKWLGIAAQVIPIVIGN
ncbi:uncharacterized protein LOC125770746 isoform X2 [Anopheles funestus]|uniref:uncharacterized protein LOC125770746 isoform X1 n=1 Tax=Anopheles funestus TaxID=62324 RepID=UPI0020C5EBE3|nr:uncharacterized protein LOC125770746 isoform X1 [Anopheles funestus]XP_049296661.1 uncharacterized protein LOC125770746 isoform X2 [Anopheles funestus]